MLIVKFPQNFTKFGFEISECQSLEGLMATLAKPSEDSESHNKGPWLIMIIGSKFTSNNFNQGILNK